MLFVGESGTAKSVAIQKYLGSFPVAENLILNVNFSSRTTSMDVQLTIEDSIEKRTKVWQSFDEYIVPSLHYLPMGMIYSFKSIVFIYSTH